MMVEAADVTFKELDAANKKKVRAIQKVTGGKPSYFQSGMSGEIAAFESGRTRFDLTILKKLVSLGVRWIEMHPRDKQFHVGL